MSFHVISASPTSSSSNSIHSVYACNCHCKLESTVQRSGTYDVKQQATLLRQSRIFLGLSRYLWTIRMLKSCDSTTRPLQKSQDDSEDESSTVGRVASGYKSASFRLAGGKRCFGAPTALANQVFSIFMAGGVGKQLIHHKSNVL